jgi:hypothetical protein
VALDLTALAVAYVVAIGCLLLGYVLAGPVWVERHSIQLAGPGKPRRVSGFWGEWALCTACAAVAATVRAFTDVAIVRDVLAPYLGWTLLVVAAIALVVWLYSRNVVAGARRDGKDKTYLKRLAAAYVPYAI